MIPLYKLYLSKYDRWKRLKLKALFSPVGHLGSQFQFFNGQNEREFDLDQNDTHFISVAQPWEAV